MIAGCGSSGSGNTDTHITDAKNADAGITGDTAGKHTAAILREFEDQEGNKYTCTLVSSDDPAVYDCVKDGTTDAYSCVLEKDTNSPTGLGTKFIFCNLKKEKYKPPCDNPLVPGDQKSGRMCWSPPDDYCSLGFGLGGAWFCNQEGTHCCNAYGPWCFLCGWVRMSVTGEYCVINEENRTLSKSTCKKIWNTWYTLNGCTTDNHSVCDRLGYEDPVCQDALQSMLNVKAICPADSK